MTQAVQVDETVLDAVRSLEQWLDAHGWKAYEPHDGLNTPLRRLLGGNRFALLALKQLVMRSPVNLRPVLGIPRQTSPEAAGFFARGYVRLHQALGSPEDRGRAEQRLDWLARHAERGYSGHCWGNQFDYVTRFFYLPKGMPIVVWTAHNAHAFLDAYEQFGAARWLDVAASAATFVYRDLVRHEGDHLYISYVPSGPYPVHNANVLGASLLARVGALTGRAELVDVARRAMRYTVAHQRPDSSWWYGEAPNLRWVDNFHTGYVLECLLAYQESTGDRTFSDAMARGLEYYVRTFFLADGTPRYYSDRTYPIDVQCAAQGIETLRLFAGEDPAYGRRARQVAEWAIRHLRDPSGYFHFRRGPRWTAKVPLLHWGQATMFSALAGLLQPAGKG
ncbi:MAG: hypothetical protein ACREOC_09655 [Gemmatimonadales bacterium]